MQYPIQHKHTGVRRPGCETSVYACLALCMYMYVLSICLCLGTPAGPYGDSLSEVTKVEENMKIR